MRALLAVVEDNGVKDTVSAIADTHDQIIMALLGLVSMMVACLVYIIRNGRLIKVAAEEATSASHAVNNIGPEDHRMYRLVEMIAERQDDFDKKWGNLPEDMDDAVGLVEMLHGMDRRISTIQSELRDHVSWEMSITGKYGKNGVSSAP